MYLKYLKKKKPHFLDYADPWDRHEHMNGIHCVTKG